MEQRRQVVAMEDKELFLRAQRGEKEARDILFNKNTGLVHHVMKRFLSRGLEAEDLFQIGAVGLLKAIDKFDTDYGVCFSTYAVPMIVGEVQRFLRDDGPIKVSRGIKENLNKLRGVREQLAQRLGREPTIAELSAESGISAEDIVLAFESGREVESIYKTVYETDDSELCLVDMLGENAESDDVLDRLFVEGLLEGLGERERRLIVLRFFENRTQVQTAKALGMSQVQVSRMEKKVLLQMRKDAAGYKV